MANPTPLKQSCSGKYRGAAVSSPRILCRPERCIGCFYCVDQCPEAALFFGGSGIQRSKARCGACLNCVEICPALVHEVSGDDEYAAPGEPVR
jgi:NAD-dependent dihydropyrimidine dehydrogenase PreA subunit